MTPLQRLYLIGLAAAAIVAIAIIIGSVLAPDLIPGTGE